MTKYFTPDFLKFFIELASNNNKDWFDKNRPRYEKNVKEPFYKFVDDLIVKLSKIDPSLKKITAKDCVFRINRDIRFAKDKTPYKMHMSAVISSEGRKHLNTPGFYFELNPECVRIYQGAYFLENPALQNLRKGISANLKKFDALVKDKKFLAAYKKIQGDVQIRLPKEFKSVFEKQPLIANKNFYWGAELNTKLITSDKLTDTMISHYKSGKPLCDFIQKFV